MDLTLSRRTLGMGAVGLAALTAMRASVTMAQEMGGTWFDMVKAHHAMIADDLNQIVATGDGDGMRRAELQHHLAYLLTAHSVAEENVLYPAIARMGMTGISDHLYIEQAHAKVGNSDLHVMRKEGPDWLAKAQMLRAAVLHHAKDEEEADIFPRLMRAAGPEMNAKMTEDYARQFQSVGKA